METSEEFNPYSSPSVLNNPNYRPYQDPSAEDVDLSKYPEPKDSTKKIRGANEMLSTVVGGLEPELVVAKGFYFFFYAAFGSLFPLMGVYFKQLGLNGAQAGVLSGIRPLVEYVAAPMWVNFAERTNRAKTILLASLACWILFTFPLGSIQPEPVGCIRKLNQTHATITVPEPVQVTFTRRRRSSEDSLDPPSSPLHFDMMLVDEPESMLMDATDDNNNLDTAEEDGTTLDLEVDDEISNSDPKVRSKRAIPKPAPGISPIKVSYAIGYDAKKQSNWVSPSFSSEIYEKDTVTKVFFLLLLLVVIGEALSSPAIVLADSATLAFLGDEAGRRYGHQRMFGSCGWAVAMFFIGIALDHSTFPMRKCNPLPQEKNYTVCFAIFVVLMGLATLVAWKMKMPEVQLPNIEMENQQGFENVDIMNDGQAQGGPAPHQKVIGEGGIPHTTVFAQQNKKIPEWFMVLKHMQTSPNCIAFLFIAWLMGIGIGLIFTFLFWHLQDFGGSPTLFGLASVINHVSEIFAYFFSSTFITQLGHVKVLCVGLLCNVLRFLYISVLRNPWWVLPFEFVQGITHAAVWAACSSYLAHNTPPELRQPAQSVLQGLHHGLGRGFGAVVGGILVCFVGTKQTFSLYGFICLITLGAFSFHNFYRKDSGFITEIPQEEDPHKLAGDATDSAHLAPHGVPGGTPGITRVHSNTRLESYGQQQGMPQGQEYFNQQQQPPPQQQQQATNPFAAADNQQYYMR